MASINNVYNDDYVIPMDTTDDYNDYEYNEYDFPEKNDNPNKSNGIETEIIKVKSSRKKAIPKVVRQNVWNTYMGEYSGKGYCFCCNYTELTSFQFECGHVVSEYNGGDVNVENLRPICSLCNKSMGKKNMVEYMTKNKIPFPKNWNGFTKAKGKETGKHYMQKEVIVIE